MTLLQFTQDAFILLCLVSLPVSLVCLNSKKENMKGTEQDLTAAKKGVLFRVTCLDSGKIKHCKCVQGPGGGGVEMTHVF